LDNFGSLVCFEFSKYSTCFQVINQIAAADDITVFEISPTPSGGILVLTAKHKNTALENIFQRQRDSLSSMILNCCYIEKLHTDLLTAYLSQNKPSNIPNLYFFETDSLADALSRAQSALNENANIIDFRVIRSTHNRCILVFSGDNLGEKFIQITQPTALTLGYFQP
jgi:hypothetical protein